MDKQPLQDIISPTGSNRRATPQNNGMDRPQSPPKPPRRQNNKREGSRYGLFIGIVILLAVLAFVFSFLFSGATVTVTPKQQNVFIDGDFSASKSEGLVYSVMELNRTLSKTVKATETEQAEERAEGQIIVYNNYNTSSHGWVKNTRFETPEGLIYKVRKSVVIPGMETIDGKKVPGSIEITVTADQPGEEYNIGLTDFTIPGLKGGAKYDSFYARSKTPMTGGFIGERLVVSDEDMINTRVKLKSDLQKELLALSSSQKPEGFILLENGIFFEFESLPNVDREKEVSIEERGILYGILFDSEELANYLAESTLADYDGSSVRIINSDELAVSFEEVDERLWEEEEISFSVNGTAEIVWNFDQNDLRFDLLGEPKNTISTVLQGYPGIQSAEAVIRPFWHRTFPSKSNKIKIQEVLN